MNFVSGELRAPSSTPHCSFDVDLLSAAARLHGDAIFPADAGIAAQLPAQMSTTSSLPHLRAPSRSCRVLVLDRLTVLLSVPLVCPATKPVDRPMLWPRCLFFFGVVDRCDPR